MIVYQYCQVLEELSMYNGRIPNTCPDQLPVLAQNPASPCRLFIPCYHSTDSYSDSTMPGGNNKVKTAKQLQGELPSDALLSEYGLHATSVIRITDVGVFWRLSAGKKGTGKKDLHPESRRVKQAARVELRTKRVTEVGWL